MCRGKGKQYSYFLFGFFVFGRFVVLHSWHVHCIEVEIVFSGNAQSECHVLLHLAHAWIGFFRVLRAEQFCMEHLDWEVSIMWRVSSELSTSLDRSVVRRFRLLEGGSGCLVRVVSRACFAKKCVLANLSLFSAC